MDSFFYFKYEVIEFCVNEDLILKRLLGCCFCLNCKVGFYIDFMFLSKGNICDKCGIELIICKDDLFELIKNRFKVYKE